MEDGFVIIAALCSFCCEFIFLRQLSVRLSLWLQFHSSHHWRHSCSVTLEENQHGRSTFFFYLGKKDAEREFVFVYRPQVTHFDLTQLTACFLCIVKELL